MNLHNLWRDYLSCSNNDDIIHHTCIYINIQIDHDQSHDYAHDDDDDNDVDDSKHVTLIDAVDVW